MINLEISNSMYEISKIFLCGNHFNMDHQFLDVRRFFLFEHQGHSLDPQSLKRSINRIGIETGLKLGK